MRLSALSPSFRSLLAVPFLAVMLAFPASAETKPEGTTPQAEAKPATGETTPDAATGEPNGSAEQPDASAEQPAAAPEQPKTSVLVNIDKSTQEMTVFIDGLEQYSWPVSTGKPGYATPSGTYAPTSMNEIWYSKQWDNSPMPHSIFFMKDGHAIHGTHEVKNLGKPASHGCVRLAPENAATLYALVKKTGMENVQVVLSGETPGGEGPNVASRPPEGPEGWAPWFDRGYGYGDALPPDRPQRRGLF